jgi:hypothetical protein
MPDGDTVILHELITTSLRFIQHSHCLYYPINKHVVKNVLTVFLTTMQNDRISIKHRWMSCYRLIHVVYIAHSSNKYLLLLISDTKVCPGTVWYRWCTSQVSTAKVAPTPVKSAIATLVFGEDRFRSCTVLVVCAVRIIELGADMCGGNTGSSTVLASLWCQNCWAICESYQDYTSIVDEH